MRNLVIAASELRPGDVLVRAGLVVEAVCRRGPCVIVHFTNGTTTASVPAGARAFIRRHPVVLSRP